METRMKMENYSDDTNNQFTKVVYYTLSQHYGEERKANCIGDYDINTRTLRIEYVNSLMHFRETGYNPKTLSFYFDKDNSTEGTSIYITDKNNVPDIYDGIFFLTDKIEDLSEKLISEHVSRIITFDDNSENNKNKIIEDGNIIILPDKTIRCTKTIIKEIYNIQLIDDKNTEAVKFENHTLYVPSDNRLCDLYHDIMLSPLLQEVNIYGKWKNITNFYNINILSKFTTVYITDYDLNKPYYPIQELNSLNIYGIINVNDEGDIITSGTNLI